MSWTTTSCPNLTLGLPVVESLLRSVTTPVDCHLMIEDPDRWAPAYAEAGAGSVTFHVEAAAAPVRLAREIRAAGARAGMGLKPATPVEPYADLLPEIDMLLLMTVEPGFGGQSFLDVVVPKIRRARELVKGRDLDLWIQVDGGVAADDHRDLRRRRRRRVRRRVRGVRRRRPGRRCALRSRLRPSEPQRPAGGARADAGRRDTVPTSRGRWSGRLRVVRADLLARPGVGAIPNRR